MIKNGGILRNQAIRQLFFQTERILLSTLGKMGLDRMEIEETSNDALIICIDNVCNGKFRKDASLSTYIVGIAKNCALNLLRKKQRRRIHENEGSEDNEEVALSPEDLMLTQERNKALLSALDKLGDPCRELLLLWANDYSYREIVGMMDYANENSAKVQKFKCLQRLISITGKGGILPGAKVS